MKYTIEQKADILANFIVLETLESEYQDAKDSLAYDKNHEVLQVLRKAIKISKGSM